MRTKPLLAVALLAIGCSSFVVAQERLAGDWERKVSSVVKEPERARKVVEAARRYETTGQASLDAMKKAEAQVQAAFRSQSSSGGDRQLSLSLLRDDRRKAAVAAVDALLEVRYLVSKKEWKDLWPESYFASAGLAPRVTGRVQKALPSVVTDPARLKQAEGVAAKLATAAAKDEVARKKAVVDFSKLLERYESRRDDFIDLVNKLEETQSRSDDALVGAAGDLQKILSPEEWSALTGLLATAA
ncbi:MAG: hypothetical protein IPP07_31825 [Holophagales bacterium]|jgi:hypothetical protein|nr:hypothetical protein [Holophagales bacterium]MBK9969165.1 hypothetical protein [Holophagales bacterium]